MKKLTTLLLAILVIVLFQTCKPKQNLAGENEKQTSNKQVIGNDTIPVNYVEKKNGTDTTKLDIVKEKSAKDTVPSVKIPVINPKIHPETVMVIDDGPEPVYDKFKTTPKIERTEISNFNPFLEKMYPGAKWYHDTYDDYEYYVNRYIATYKGAEFACTYVNSFVYYFYDVGEISHEDLIKTLIYWCLQPEYPDINITETKLYDEKKFDDFSTNKYYLTTGKIDNESLEVKIIINRDMICSIVARKNQKLIKQLISFI